jgi:hypothetical protein
MNTTSTKTQNTGHLDELTLELCRLGEASDEDRAHLQGCTLCQTRLENLEGVAADLHFENLPIPNEVDKAVFALADENALRVKRTHKMRKRLLWAAPAAAAAAAFIMVVIPGQMSAPEQDAPSPLELAVKAESSAAEKENAEEYRTDEASVDERIAALDGDQGGENSPSPQKQSVTKPEDPRPELADSRNEGTGNLSKGTDINGDGKLNILDAYAMAKALKAGGVKGKAWDQNGDGQVNARDVRSLALAAVALSEKSR